MFFQTFSQSQMAKNIQIPIGSGADELRKLILQRDPSRFGPPSFGRQSRDFKVQESIEVLE